LPLAEWTKTCITRRWPSLAIVFFITLMASFPAFALIYSWTLDIEQGLWQHFLDHVLGRATINTIGLVCTVSIASLIIGTTTAWWTTMFRFPGRKLLSALLLTPLAVPAYVLAFVYTGLLDWSGPIQTWGREYAPQLNAPLQSFRGFWGAFFVLTLALYPYVYLVARAAFATQGQTIFEVARSLGAGPGKIFWKIALPMARPWLLGATSLVAMETLADFGAVSIFSVDTITTAVHKAWFGFFSPALAAQLASFLIVIAIILGFVSSAKLDEQRFATRRAGWDGTTPFDTSMLVQYLITGTCTAIVGLGFILPVLQLAVWSRHALADTQGIRLGEFLLNTLMLSTVAAVITTVTAVALALATKRNGSGLASLASRIAVTGYAIPGAVLAAAFFVPVATFDNLMSDLAAAVTKQETSLFLTGTLFVTVGGLAVRYLAVAHQSVASGLARIPRSFDEESAISGVHPVKVATKIHLPLLATPIFAGLVLTFLDVSKELPMTLMTRPAGWDTLAVRVYEMTSEGDWIKASVPAVLLVLMGLLPAVLILRRQKILES
jgi:iron(III) transport system permease protein